MILTVAIFGVLSFLLGVILGCTSYKFNIKKDPIIEVINDLLPQSQCAQCGYSGCYPYAQAIVEKSEEFNKCVPGGIDLTKKIAKKLNLEMSENNSITDNKKIFNTTVLIDENNCVGCSKCAIFCPVDAIVGSPNFMHTVLQDFCTGCNICLSHCPTNCINIIKRDS